MRPIIPYLRFPNTAQEPGSQEWLEQRRQRLFAEIRLIESLQRNWKKHPRRDGLLFTRADQERNFLHYAHTTLLRFRDEYRHVGALRPPSATR